jgi:putative ABC transport system permease protein
MTMKIQGRLTLGIGVLFGYLPARRAARLNPIEALRYD